MFTEHSMKIDPQPFSMIKSGSKTIELRLYDEKRRRISAGDTIIFTNTGDISDRLTAEVTELYIFRDFEELYGALPLTECGYTEENVSSASFRDMEKYYPPEAQKRCSVVGIGLKVIK